MTKGIKYMNIQEFVEQGFLQEANRQFFHPLGLALEVTDDTDAPTGAQWFISGVWDYREDPEGMEFGYRDGNWDKAEAKRKRNLVAAERRKHRATRIGLFGQEIEPIK